MAVMRKASSERRPIVKGVTRKVLGQLELFISLVRKTL